MAVAALLRNSEKLDPPLRSRRWLTAKIKEMRQGHPRVKYVDICKELTIRNVSGEPDPGMAKLIEKGYEPKKKATRERLRLYPLTTCPACHHKLKRARKPPLSLSSRVRAFWRAVKRDPEQEARAAKLAYGHRAQIRKGVRR